MSKYCFECNLIYTTSNLLLNYLIDYLLFCLCLNGYLENETTHASSRHIIYSLLNHLISSFKIFINLVEKSEKRIMKDYTLEDVRQHLALIIILLNLLFAYFIADIDYVFVSVDKTLGCLFIAEL